jgi:hypothetical protein
MRMVTPPLLMKLSEILLNLLAKERIQRRQRFIQKEQAGLRPQRPGQREPRKLDALRLEGES